MRLSLSLHAAACQRWDASQSEIENGIFLGRFAALTLSGTYQMDGKILAFDFDNLKLRLGGWTGNFSLKAKRDPRRAPRAPRWPDLPHAISQLPQLPLCR
jgi:hypothetical protein